jgi:hypothetical protein
VDSREHLPHRAGRIVDRKLHRTDHRLGIDQQGQPLEVVGAARPERRQQQPGREFAVLIGQKRVGQPRVRDERRQLVGALHADASHRGAGGREVGVP